MKSRKAAIDLSMSMLVIIIISLVILAAGIALLYKLIGGATDIKMQLDERTEEELQRLLVDQGKQVALPLHRATIQRGENHVFGLGILNIGIGTDQFRLEVRLSSAVDEENVGIPFTPDQKDALVAEWVLYDREILVLTEGDHRKESINVIVPKSAIPGTYIFDVKVHADNNPYGNKQKFYVLVK